MKKLYLFIFINLLLFPACQTDKIVQVDKDKRVKDLDSFFKHIESRKKDVKHIFLESKVDTFNRSKRVRGKMMMFVSRPKSVRVDTLSPFEQPISTLLIKDDSLNFYNLEKNTLYYGRSSTKNLSNFLPMRLSVEQFIDILSGIAPMIPFDSHSLKYEKSDATYRLTIEDGVQKEIIWYVASTFQIKRLKLYRDGKKQIDIEFSNFKKSSNISYAKKIVYIDYTNDIKIKLNITDIEFNNPPKGDIFSPLNGNYKKESLDL